MAANCYWSPNDRFWVPTERGGLQTNRDTVLDDGRRLPIYNITRKDLTEGNMFGHLAQKNWVTKDMLVDLFYRTVEMLQASAPSAGSPATAPASGDTYITIRVPTFEPRGEGFAWCAEALRPWTGGKDDSRFCHRTEVAGMAEFTLRCGGVYFLSKPQQEPGDGEDAPTYTVTRGYWLAEPDGLKPLTRAQANNLLTQRLGTPSSASNDEDAEW